MVRKFIRAGLFTALGVATMALAFGAATAGQDKKDKKDDKLPEISEIMLKGHKGTDAFLAKIRGEAKAEKWEDAVAHAKALNVFGEALGKHKAPKGDDKSWKELTTKYAGSTKTVLEGTEKKDVKLVNKGLGAINCKECHDKHK